MNGDAQSSEIDRSENTRGRYGRHDESIHSPIRPPPAYAKGLAGVVAGETSVSQVQGEEGRLIYRGVPVEEMAARSTFEECAFFLLRGYLPGERELNESNSAMRLQRILPKSVTRTIDSANADAHPMSILQAAVAAMDYDIGARSIRNEDQNQRIALSLISRIGTAIARISRHRRGLRQVEPRLDLSHVENFLFMMNGEVPDAETAHVFEGALILHMDHDFNASTFTSRVIASTESSMAAALSGAVGALSGPLHGGANEKVMEMVDRIGSPDQARAWIKNALAAKEKIMGFGHRVYRTTDPRAVYLRSMLERLVSKTGRRHEYDILAIVHDAMVEELSKKDKDYVWPNVDFWSGAFYRVLGFESADFTPIFALARSVGWCAHILENWRDNRIFRPAAWYIGPQKSEYTKSWERH